MAKIFRILLALIFISGGIFHFIVPHVYRPFFPDWVPMVDALIYISGVVEIAVGAMLFAPTTRKLGAIGIIALLIAFTPLHIRDFFLDEPVLQEMTFVIVRIPIQVLMLWMAWVVYKDAPKV